jgi:triphosphatase
MPNEIELKLLIDPAHLTRLLRHPLLKVHTRRKLPTQRLLSVYYDTPDLTLHKSKTAVRLRRVGKRWIQTVKTEGRVSAGLHERPEWEYETAEHTLNFEQLEDPKLRDFFADDRLRQALRPVFTTEFSRARRILEWPSGEVAELALDHGEIRAGDRTRPLCEVELELKTGAPARLFEFALELQQTIPLKLENVSKAERGYRLAANTTISPVKAQTLTLDPHLPASDAFVHIAQSCIAHIQANEEGVLQSDDPEFVHQMRVAVRRLRSALSVFSEIIDRAHAEPIREELRWLTKELDGARNWDVFVLQTLPPIVSAFPEYAGFTWLASQSAAVRTQTNTQAQAAVASTRYQRFLLAFGSWLATGVWQAQPTPVIVGTTEAPVTEFATRVLHSRHRRLKKRGEHWETLAPEERHQVRIAAKKLRYAAEFFSSLYPRKRTRRYIVTLAQLQDLLGSMNDAATTVTLMQTIATTATDVQQQQAISLVSGWVLGYSHAQLTALATTWRHFLDRKTFWS